VQQQQDKLERAAQSYREAPGWSRNVRHFMRPLGTVLIAAGRHDEAIAAFERALELEDGHAEALAGLAHALSTVGQTEARDCNLSSLHRAAPRRRRGLLGACESQDVPVYRC
jgi:Flp pilus assembly protein TadD